MNAQGDDIVLLAEIAFNYFFALTWDIFEAMIYFLMKNQFDP